jgi:hypothetical protein
LFLRPRQRLRSVASPVEFIPPGPCGAGFKLRGLWKPSILGGGMTIVRIPPIRVMFWGPRTGAAGPAAILCVRQLGSQALLIAPQRVRIGNQGTICNRYPRGMSDPPAHNRSPPCIHQSPWSFVRSTEGPPAVKPGRVTQA